MALDSQRWQRAGRLSAVGLELGFSVVAGLLLGQWLDGKFGTAPWLLLAGLLVGAVAGFRTLVRALRDLTGKNDEPPDAAPRP